MMQDNGGEANATQKGLQASFATSKIEPRPSKIEARGSPGTKIHPRGAPDQPRGAQEALKRAQQLPKSVQKPAKWRPRAAQDGPRSLQNRARRIPKRGFSTIFVGSCVRQAPPTILCRFLVCATVSRDVKNLEKPMKNHGFYTSGALSH